MITPLQSAAGTSATGSTGSASNTNEAQDRFLKLLVTQMKNQDPLNPMDNAQVTTQMAQISTVTGIGQLNDTLKNFLGQLTGNQAVQGASLAGRQVLVSGNAIDLAAGGAAAGYELPAAVDRVTFSVLDSSGSTIRQEELGPKASGVHTLSWNGLTTTGDRAVDGRYTFKIDALAAGAAAPVTTLAYGRVAGVLPGSNGLQLNLGLLGLRAYTDVKEIQ